LVCCAGVERLANALPAAITSVFVAIVFVLLMIGNYIAYAIRASIILRNSRIYLQLAEIQQNKIDVPEICFGNMTRLC
jgi:hypothetical protein